MSAWTNAPSRPSPVGPKADSLGEKSSPRTAMKIGMTGTREGGSDSQFVAVRQLIASLRPDEFHHGCCLGADEEIGVLVYDSYPFMRVVGHPSDIKDMTSSAALAKCHEVRECRSPLMRNWYIVNEVDRLIAIPVGPEKMRSGTWATVRYARKIGKPIYIIYQDGTVATENGAA